MRCGRNLLKTMVFAAAIFLAGTRDSMAQQHPPDPTMLLNLDLFAARGNSEVQPAGGDSMLSQIRALQAMGYLNGAGPAGSQPAGLPAPPTAPPLPESQNEILE